MPESPDLSRARKRSIPYQHYSCENIKQELLVVDYKRHYKRLATREAEALKEARQLESKAHNSKVARDPFVKLFPPYGMFMDHIGPQKDITEGGIIKQFKEKHDALEYMAKQKQCNFIHE